MIPLNKLALEWVISKYAKSPSVGNLLTFVVNVDGKKSQYTVKL